MRYREIVERSVRMGAKDLASTKTDNFLVGFEFEIACEPSLVKTDEINARYDFDDMSFLHPDTSFEDWLADEFGRDPAKMINHYDLEPVHPVTAGDMWEENGADPDDEPEDKDKVFPGKYFDGRYICDYDEVTDEDTLEGNFKNTREVIRHYHSWAESKMDRAFQDWYSELGYDQENTENAKARLSDAIREALPYTIEEQNIEQGIGDTVWKLVPDGSIEPAGIELVSPPMEAKAALQALKRVCSMITKDPEMETNESTGLHINVSVPNSDKIDLLKLLLFMGEGYVLDIFDRKGNKYAKPLLDEVVRYLKTREGDINRTIDELNDFMIKNANHHHTIDINKLAKGYLEFRAGGNTGYEKKYKEVEKLIRRYVRIITLASDPDAEREAYLKKLYQAMTMPNYEDTPWQEIGIKSESDFYDQIESDPVVSGFIPVNPLDNVTNTVKFFNSLSVDGTPSRSSLVLMRKILQKMKSKMSESDILRLERIADKKNNQWLLKIMK